MDIRDALDACQYKKAEMMMLRREQRSPVTRSKRKQPEGERFECPQCGTVGYGALRECPFCFLKWSA